MGLIPDEDSMAGISTTSASSDHVCPLGEQINDLSFAFVSPLEANDGDHSLFWEHVND